METIKRNSRRTCFVLSSLLAASLSAQTTADTKTEQSANDDVIKLSPFEVSTEKDTGYKASNSIGGTRSNTPIKDIALNIQVFTKDLADDLIIADQTALERYNAAMVNGGADVQSDNNIQQQYNAFLFRGFVQNWGLRDGVRNYDPIDSQGIARVEIVKGPAAALYGLAYAGGVMNTIIKQVDFHQNFGSVRFTGQDQGGYRATIDANYTGKLNSSGGMFGVRFNAAGGASEDKREHSKGETHFTQTNLEFQPWKGTSLAFLVEKSDRQKPNGLGYYTRSAGTNPTKTGEAGIGASIPLQIDHPEIPWTWNWANANNTRSLENRFYRGTITQAIGEDFHLMAYIQTSARNQIDSNGWDDNGNSQNAAGWDVANWSQFGSIPTGWINPGTANEAIRKVYHYRDWNDFDHASGVNAVYKFEVAGIKNTLTGGAANWTEDFVSRKFLEPDPLAFDTNSDGSFKAWKYLPAVLPAQNARGTWPAPTVFDLPVRSGINTSAPLGGAAPSDYVSNFNEGGRERNTNKYYYASWQMYAFNDRLKLNAAINHTTIKNRIYSSSSAPTPDATQNVDVSKTSPMFGGMFDITKEISVFAVHSTSLFPTTDKNSFSVQMPAEVGKSNEVGVKMELLEGKISGTVSYYNIKKSGGGVTDSSHDNKDTQAWDGMTPAQRAISYPGKTRTDIAGDVVPAELESKGFEVDLVVQPIKSLQFVFSYANNDQKSTKGSNLGQPTAGNVKQQYAALSRYSFTDGAVKGLFLGLGFQGADKALQDYQGKVARYNPRTFYAEFFSGYKFKAFGYNQVVQFNAKNLTKQDDFIGWKPTGNASAVATERYAVPTYAQLSLTWGIDF